MSVKEAFVVRFDEDIEKIISGLQNRIDYINEGVLAMEPKKLADQLLYVLKVALLELIKREVSMLELAESTCKSGSKNHAMEYLQFSIEYAKEYAGSNENITVAITSMINMDVQKIIVNYLKNSENKQEYYYYESMKIMHRLLSL